MIPLSPIVDIPRILTTAGDVCWPQTDVIELRPGAKGRLTRLKQIVARARSYDLVMLNGAVSFSQWYDEILIAGFLARLHPAPCIVLEGCYWEEGTRVVDRFSRRRADRPFGFDPPAQRGRTLAHGLVSWVRRPSIYYIVFGAYERRAFSVRWSVPEERVLNTLYHSHQWAEPGRPEGTAIGGYVFAGGDSLRDYRPLLEAAPTITAPVVIATTLAMPPTPPSVTAGKLPEQAYRRTAVGAKVHVVPMITDPPRSSGQASYLDALMLGIPVVVTDGLGVRDHLRDGHDALIVPPGDPGTLAAAVNRCLSDPELSSRLSQAGRSRAVKEFTLGAFRSREYDLIIDAWARHASGPSVAARI
jgi:glycosyltransferase involved in cell wall biosynthesis